MSKERLLSFLFISLALLSVSFLVKTYNVSNVELSAAENVYVYGINATYTLKPNIISLQASLNKTPLVEGVDYSVDYANGTIVFNLLNTTVAAGDTVFVRYQYQTSVELSTLERAFYDNWKLALLVGVIATISMVVWRYL